MKTIRQWLEELPEPYKTQAINNTNNPELLTVEEQCASNAVGSAFTWAESPEGLFYWKNFYESLVEKEEEGKI